MDSMISVNTVGWNEAKLPINPQTTSFTPQQQQAVKILPLNSAALAQKIQQFADLETDLSITELRQALPHLQELEPSGVGCRDLSECLTIQLDALTSKQVEVAHAKTVVANYLDLLARNKRSVLSKKLGANQLELHRAIELIQTLDPNPSRQIQSATTIYINADVMVSKNNGQWATRLEHDNMPQIGLSSYIDTWSNQLPDEAKKPLLNQVQQAKTLTSHLENRYQTTLRVAAEIVRIQQDYFERGAVALKPLTLKQVADALGIHISTVSKTINGKYMLSNEGLTELKFFFSAALTQENGDSVFLLISKRRLKRW